jgi:hypothetical protein
MSSSSSSFDSEDRYGFGVMIVFGLMFVAWMVFNYFVDGWSPQDVGYGDAKRFVEGQGYAVAKTTGSDLLCYHDKTMGDTTGVGFVLLKDGVKTNVVICDMAERVYEWPKNDPAHVGYQKWVDTKHYLTIRQIVQ